MLDDAPGLLKRFAYALTPGRQFGAGPEAHLGLAIVGLLATCERGYVPYAWASRGRCPRNAVDIIFDLVVEAASEVLEDAESSTNARFLANQFGELDHLIRTYHRLPSSWTKSN